MQQLKERLDGPGCSSSSGSEDERSEKPTNGDKKEGIDVELSQKKRTARCMDGKPSRLFTLT